MYKYVVYVGRTTNKGKELSRTYVYDTIVNKLLENGIQGATLIDAIGMWEGKAEKSVQVVIYNGTCINKQVYNFIHEINACLQQDCCLCEIDNNCSYQCL